MVPPMLTHDDWNRLHDETGIAGATFFRIIRGKPIEKRTRKDIERAAAKLRIKLPPTLFAYLDATAEGAT